jgi:WD40 repeat protein
LSIITSAEQELDADISSTDDESKDEANAVRVPFQWSKVKTLKGIESMGVCLAFSPDGRLLASGGGDGIIQLWDVAEGTEFKRLTGHTDSVHSVAFSPDGHLLASGSEDDTMRLWNIRAAAGTEGTTLEGHTIQVNCVAFSLDGQLLASASYDGTVKFWNIAAVERKVEARKVEGLGEGRREVALSPDLGLIASASGDGRTVILSDIMTGAAVQRLKGHTDIVWSFAFSADGQLIASGSKDATVRLWKTSTGVEIRKLDGHKNSIWSVAFSPNGQIVATGCWDGDVRFWEVENRQRSLTDRFRGEPSLTKTPPLLRFTIL